jgi:hypothetical protein
MAIIENGILGGFRGKVGAVVGTRLRGQDIMKSRGPRKRVNNSPKQLIQQAKFGIAVDFVRHLSDLVNLTYKVGDRISTPSNRAVKELVSNAITGVYPDFKLDFPKVRISRGSLQSVSATSVAAAGKITWTWVPNGLTPVQDLDQSVIVAYCPERKQTLYKVNASTRADGTAILDVTPFIGLTVVTYLSFTSPNQSKISDSVFTGELLVS